MAKKRGNEKTRKNKKRKKKTGKNEKSEKIKKKEKRTKKLERISFLKEISKDFKEEIEKENPRSEILDKLFKELYFFATKDHLTGVFNRQALNELLSREMERAVRYDLPLSVVMIDIDDFKIYNDTYGHLQGDEALRKVTKIIMQNTRKEDFVARYGGEEFIIVLPNTKIRKSIEVAERIRVAISRAKIKKTAKDIEPGFEGVTVSMGISQISGRGIKDMIHRADIALYKAKKEGKNKICVLEVKKVKK